MSIDGLASRYEVHRTTVIHHLDHAGVTRRRVARKMTDESVALAAARYKEGASLAIVANEFGGINGPWPGNSAEQAHPSSRGAAGAVDEYQRCRLRLGARGRPLPALR